jgi:ribosomal protein S3
MQAGGAQGIAEIHALAHGSRSQVHQFNRLNAQTNSALANAGAHAVANESMARLHQRRANEESMERAIKRALHGSTVKISPSKLRLV